MSPGGASPYKTLLSIPPPGCEAVIYPWIGGIDESVYELWVKDLMNE